VLHLLTQQLNLSEARVEGYGDDKLFMHSISASEVINPETV
jgi:hypothetical protein